MIISKGEMIMGKMKSRLKRFVVWCMAVVMLCMSGPFTANVAALESETPELAAAKTVKIKNAKVGTKVTVGNYTYRITALTPKKKTVEVTGFTKKAKKKRTEVMVPAFLFPIIKILIIIIRAIGIVLRIIDIA